jgi:hypothetical protein
MVWEKEYRPRVFKNSCYDAVWSKNERPTAGWRKLHHEEFHDL